MGNASGQETDMCHKEPIKSMLHHTRKSLFYNEPIL